MSEVDFVFYFSTSDDSLSLEKPVLRRDIELEVILLVENLPIQGFTNVLHVDVSIVVSYGAILVKCVDKCSPIMDALL